VEKKRRKEIKKSFKSGLRKTDSSWNALKRGGLRKKHSEGKGSKRHGSRKGSETGPEIGKNLKTLKTDKGKQDRPEGVQVRAETARTNAERDLSRKLKKTRRASQWGCERG